MAERNGGTAENSKVVAEGSNVMAERYKGVRAKSKVVLLE